MRLALVTNIPSPYRVPVWNALAKLVDALHVYFCSAGEPNRIWKQESATPAAFSQIRLPGVHFFVGALDWGLHFNPVLWAELKQFKPDHLVIGGYESPSYLLALIYAKLHRIPVTLWWSSHARSSRFRNGVVVRIKRHILGMFDSFCATSTAARSYLMGEMGISERRIVLSINAVDVQRWHAAIRPDHDPERGPTRFLYVGQFIERKGVIELLTAFEGVPQERGVLRLVGYGPQEDRIRGFITEHGLVNVEVAPATRTLEETARHYSWADVLVMPSISEVWGLVVNEALAGGLYVLASRNAGATYDLIEQAPVDVGESFDPSDTGNFTRTLLSAIDRRAGIDRQAIAGWGLRHTPEAYARGLWEAISIATAPERSA